MLAFARVPAPAPAPAHPHPRPCPHTRIRTPARYSHFGFHHSISTSAACKHALPLALVSGQDGIAVSHHLLGTLDILKGLPEIVLPADPLTVTWDAWCEGVSVRNTSRSETLRKWTDEQLVRSAWMHLEMERASHRVLPRL
jgi:hypothetical protein